MRVAGGRRCAIFAAIMLRILIADDHAIMRRGVRAVLEEHPGWEIVAEASNGREAVEMAERLRPEICIVDVSMPELNGIETTRRIRAALPGTEVVVLTVHDSEDLAASILAVGARGYVLKGDVAQDLVAAVEALSRHTPFFTRKVAESVVDRLVNGRPAVQGVLGILTPREREIVQLIAEGRRSHRIALMLGISDKTVETHRTAILRKLHLKSVVDVVRFAIRNGIVTA
jgi:DNA-binding NarL/FixJ family response regulator